MDAPLQLVRTTRRIDYQGPVNTLGVNMNNPLALHPCLVMGSAELPLVAVGDHLSSAPKPHVRSQCIHSQLASFAVLANQNRDVGVVVV